MCLGNGVVSTKKGKLDTGTNQSFAPSLFFTSLIFEFDGSVLGFRRAFLCGGNSKRARLCIKS